MKTHSFRSAMVDLTYYIESKQRYRDHLTAKGKDVAGVSAEIATIEAIRDYVEYLETQQEYWTHRALKAESITTEARKSIRTAMAVQEARQWAIITGKHGFAKLLTMIERNPDYFDVELTASAAYDDQHFFILKLLEKKFNPYNEEHVSIYKSYCEFAGLPEDKKLQEWRKAYDKKQERENLEEWLTDKAKNEEFLAKLYELIPKLKEIQP